MPCVDYHAIVKYTVATQIFCFFSEITSTMDLLKVRKFEFRFEVTITERVLNLLSNQRVVSLRYLTNIQSICDFISIPSNNYIHLYIGNFQEDEERVFFHVTTSLPDGRVVDRKFWNYANIPIMPRIDLCSMERGSKISIVLRVGLYEGEGSVWDWQNILTDINDFTVLSVPTYHFVKMNELLESGDFSDVTLVCSDNLKIKSHKCLLQTAPYFRALLSGNFDECQKQFIHVEYEYSMMKILLSFLYSGSICNANVENWPDLFILASFYGVDGLARYCELQMMTKIRRNMEYAKRILHFAIRFNAFKLKKYVIRLVRNIQERRFNVA